MSYALEDTIADEKADKQNGGLQQPTSGAAAAAAVVHDKGGTGSLHQKEQQDPQGEDPQQVVAGGATPPPPVNLCRNVARHHHLAPPPPGAFAISGGQQEENFVNRGGDNDLLRLAPGLPLPNTEYHHHHHHHTGLLGEAITAQLVVDTEEEEGYPEAAKREINRLRRQVGELMHLLSHQNDQLQQQSAAVANDTIVVAEAVSSGTPWTRTAPTTRQLTRPKRLPMGGMPPSQQSSMGDNNNPPLGGDRTNNNRRIHYSSLKLKLHGREKEQQVLLECLEKSQTQKQLLLIAGYSGVGKTVLAESLKPYIVSRHGGSGGSSGLFVLGKFDLYLRDQPYFAFVEASQQICNSMKEIQEQNPTEFIQIIDNIKAKLNPRDLALLADKLVPGLRDIMGDYIVAGEEAGEGAEAKSRLLYVFRLFIRAVADCFSPLVIVLDDAQWGDPASLDLMLSILTDSTNHNLLLIGLYRSNEVKPSTPGFDVHLLTTVLNELRTRDGDEALAITDVELDNLSPDSVHSVVKEILQAPNNDNTQGLSEICYKRTQGNAFFLISFLTMLEEEGLLKYSTESEEFEWDNEVVNSSTSATSNIVEMMTEKMSKLPQDLGRVLSMAACLGASFDRARLEVIWANLGHKDDESFALLQQHLSSAVEEGFLEAQNPEQSKYRFVHDKIQESAFALIPEGQTGNFKFQIGKILLDHLDEMERRGNIFLLANLLKDSLNGPLSPAEQIELAELNLLATQEALGCSAMPSAATYADKGIEYLPSDCWKSHYKLSLDLYSSAAEAHEVMGNVAQMNHCCDEVIAQDIPISDKLRVYNALTYNIANSGKHLEAITMLMDVLDRLGISLPRTPKEMMAATQKGLKNLKKGLKFRTPEEVECLPIVHDQGKAAAIKMLDRLSQYSYLAGSPMTGLSLIKSIELTLKWGITPVSSPAFAGAAVIFSGTLNDLQAATKIFSYSLLLEEKVGTGLSSSRIKMVGGDMAWSWTEPWADVTKILLEGYADGMACGDVESAMYSIFSWISVVWFASRPLQQLDIDCETYTRQMRELKRNPALDYTLICWQAVRNLMGLSEDPTLLQGDVISNFEEFSTKTGANMFVVLEIMDIQIKLHTIFCEYQTAADTFIQQGFDWPKYVPGQPFYMETVFQGGVACFAVAKSSVKKEYRKFALKARSTIKDWAAQGNCNVKHHAAFLDAEYDALRKKKREAEANYLRAIALGQKGGLVHDVALTYERLSHFTRVCMKDDSMADYYMTEAIRKYAEWGATKKVDLLKEQWPCLVP